MKQLFIGFIATAFAVAAGVFSASAMSEGRPQKVAMPQTDGSGVCSTSGCVVTICDKSGGTCTTYWCANNQACVKVSSSKQ